MASDGEEGTSMYRRRRDDDGDTAFWGCLIILLLFVIALPFCGLFLLLFSKDDMEAKFYGTFLLVLGIAFWIYVALH